MRTKSTSWNIIIPFNLFSPTSALCALEVSHWLQVEHEEDVRTFLIEDDSPPQIRFRRSKFLRSIHRRIDLLRWKNTPVLCLLGVGASFSDSWSSCQGPTITLDLRKRGAAQGRLSNSLLPDLPLSCAPRKGETEYARFGRARHIAQLLLSRKSQVMGQDHYETIALGAAPIENPLWLIIRAGDATYRWGSLREILPSLEVAWGATCGRINPVFLDPESPAFFAKIKLILERTSPSAVVFLACMPVLVKKLRVLFPNVPFWFHLHGDGPSGGDALTGEPYDLFRRHDVMIAACEADARAMKHLFPNAKVHVVPFPLETVPGYPRPLRSGIITFPESHSLRLIFVGRVTARKNIHILFKAMAMLRDQHDIEASLEIYGSPDLAYDPFRRRDSFGYPYSLDALSKKLGLQSQLKYAGHVPRNDLAAAMVSGPGIFVSMSLQPDENYGAAVALALHLGLPAVLSAWGGHRDFKNRYPDQVTLVPVRSSPIGPQIHPEEVSSAIFSLLQKKGFGQTPNLTQHGVQPASKIPECWLEESSPPKDFSPLEASSDLQILRMRGEKSLVAKVKKPIFEGPGDPIDLKLAIAYGMDSDAAED